jgi:hypothetical protein
MVMWHGLNGLEFSGGDRAVIETRIGESEFVFAWETILSVHC